MKKEEIREMSTDDLRERLQQMERRNADTARLLFSREKKATKKEL